MKMFNQIALTLCAAVALFLSGCSGGDTHEKVADDIMAQMDRMAGAMGSITDKASAEKAVTEIKSVTEELKKLAARAKALGQPSADVKAKIEAKMKEKEAALSQKMQASQANLAKAGPEAGMIVMKGMMEIQPAMKEIGEAFADADKK